MISKHSWALCYEIRGVLHTREEVSEVIILTQLIRKLQLRLRLLVPPSIILVLVIIITIFIFMPTLMIIFSFLFIPSRLLLPFGLDVCMESTLVDWVG